MEIFWLGSTGERGPEKRVFVSAGDGNEADDENEGRGEEEGRWEEANSVAPAFAGGDVIAGAVEVKGTSTTTCCGVPSGLAGGRATVGEYESSGVITITRGEDVGSDAVCKTTVASEAGKEEAKEGGTITSAVAPLCVNE